MPAHNYLAKIAFIAAISSVLVGCPKMAKIRIINNTGARLEVVRPVENRFVDPGNSTSFLFGDSYLEIHSAEEFWIYERNIPLNGRRGEFYDGTLRLLIEPDGRAFVLKSDLTPSAADLEVQPEGYPLRPQRNTSR